MARGEKKTLFDDAPGEAVRFPPAWVVKELIDVHGMRPETARRLPHGVAFARLWAMRRKSMAFGPDERKAAAREVFEKLAKAVANEFTPTHELTDLCAEAVAILDGPDVARVASGLANLLAEVAA